MSVAEATAGGTLEVKGLADAEVALEPGDVLLLDARVRHRVTPVIASERRSLAAWYLAR